MTRRRIEELDKRPAEVEEEDVPSGKDRETEGSGGVYLPGVNEVIEPISFRKALGPEDLELLEEAVRIVAEQLRLGSLPGETQRNGTVVYRGLSGGKLCPNCLHTYLYETDYSCAVCEGAICPECAVILPVTDRVLCSTCLTGISEEA